MPKARNGNKGKNAGRKIHDKRESDEIRHDLDSLRNNVVALTKHLKENGNHRVHEISERARHKIDDVKKASAEEFHEIEQRIARHPRRSIAAAFLTGFLASLALKRRWRS